MTADRWIDMDAPVRGRVESPAAPLPAWIIVENGDIFEGTPEQFDDCFLALPDLSDGEVVRSIVAAWCAVDGWDATFLDEVPAEFA